jgi:peptidoglycan/LPS O-acetylase OafA/YrhL
MSTGLDRTLELEPAAAAEGIGSVAQSPKQPSSIELTKVKAPAAGSEGESSHQLRALHGLRFLAAFCILFSHAFSWLGNFKDYGEFGRFGEFFTVYGMPLFFVLSGFVIHYNYSRLFSTMRPGWAVVEFLGARFARIYPLFICFFLVGLATDEVLLWAYHHKLNLLLVLGHELTLTQSWVYVVLYGDRLVLDGTFGLSWSLSTEFFFYLAYIALVLHFTRLRNMTSLLVIVGAMSLLILVAFGYAAAHRNDITAFARQHMNDQFQQWDHSVYRWFFYYSPYSRVFEFILGCLTAQVFALLADQQVSSGEARLGRYLLVASLAYLLAFGLIYLYEPFGQAVAPYVELLKLNFGCAVAIAILIFCVSRYRSSAVAVMLSTPLMVLLGDLSYSIYTVHTWTLRIFERPQMTYSPGVACEALFRIALGIALTIVLSTATYRLIEVPARAWVRRLVKQRLTRSFGTREANMLVAGEVYSSRAAITLGLAVAVIIGLTVAYQFLIVPHFSAYTR